jgi:hypothetical protein
MLNNFIINSVFKEEARDNNWWIRMLRSYDIKGTKDEAAEVM